MTPTFWRFLRYTRPYWHICVGSVVCGVAKFSLALLLPGALGLVVKYAVEADLTAEQHRSSCADICFRPHAAEGYAAAAGFFDKVRDLPSTASWTTHVGMQDLRYVGNVPLPRWDPPPAAVLRHI